MRLLQLTVLASAVVLSGCGDDDCCTGVIQPDTLDECTGPGRTKIQFSREQSCANDGAVEWCIPDGDTQLMAALTAISSEISCSAGGGHARCNTGGLLLCYYPTLYPEHCLERHGEMKPEVWNDICEVAAQPAIVEIVPSFSL